jgi:IS30 family transposase
MKYHHLAFEERYLIEVLQRKKTSIRDIAEYLGRSPNTVSREVRKKQCEWHLHCKESSSQSMCKKMEIKAAVFQSRHGQFPPQIC